VTIPKAMASVRADGGIVSKAHDCLSFLKAFMTGPSFPVRTSPRCSRNGAASSPPLEVGVGIMRFALPLYFSPFRPAPSMVGHSGASGAVLFYVPDLDLYISGTVNQIRKRSLSYNVMVRLVFACQDCWGKR
jgi:CubicO group peptidase (beta-lactamase class C family)